MHVRLTIGHTSVWGRDNEAAFLFVSGMAIDADGAPTAYHGAPDQSLGLDNLANAGHPGNWWGIVTDDGTAKGNPVVQGDGDPAPGFYVSSTSLADPSVDRTDPLRYVDSTSIPFIVLPRQAVITLGARLGDFALVRDLKTGFTSAAVFADGGPAGKLGEGSIALADAIGIPSSPRTGGTSSRHIAYLVFAGSRGGFPQSSDDLSSNVDETFSTWGGETRLQKWIAAATATPANQHHPVQFDLRAQPADIRTGPSPRPTMEQLTVD